MARRSDRLGMFVSAAPVLLLALLARAPAATAQSISELARSVDVATEDPHPVLRNSGHRAAGAHDLDLPITTARDQCYEIVGVARSAAAVTVEVHLHTS